MLLVVPRLSLAVAAQRCVFVVRERGAGDSGSLCAGLVAFDVFAALAGW